MRTKQPVGLQDRKTAPSAKQSLVLGAKMPATAVGGTKQNSLPMNPPPQLLSPGPWTLPLLEGGQALPKIIKYRSIHVVANLVLKRFLKQCKSCSNQKY